MPIRITIEPLGNETDHAVLTHSLPYKSGYHIPIIDRITALEEAARNLRYIVETLEEQERRIEAGGVRTIDDGIPGPVHTREVNDCGVCATQYACRWFCIPEDREEIKRVGRWNSATGMSPALEYLHRFGIETPGWYCKGLDATPDPDRPGVTVQPPTPVNIDRLFEAYCDQLDTGAIGLATIMIPAGPHAVCIIAASQERGTITAVCSLRGVYSVHKSEFFTGPAGKLNGKVVWWARRKVAAPGD